MVVMMIIVLAVDLRQKLLAQVIVFIRSSLIKQTDRPIQIKNRCCLVIKLVSAQEIELFFPFFTEL